MDVRPYIYKLLLLPKSATFLILVLLYLTPCNLEASLWRHSPGDVCNLEGSLWRRGLESPYNLDTKKLVEKLNLVSHDKPRSYGLENITPTKSLLDGPGDPSANNSRVSIVSTRPHSKESGFRSISSSRLYTASIYGLGGSTPTKPLFEGPGDPSEKNTPVSIVSTRPNSKETGFRYISSSGLYTNLIYGLGGSTPTKFLFDGPGDPSEKNTPVSIVSTRPNSSDSTATQQASSCFVDVLSCAVTPRNWSRCNSRDKFSSDLKAVRKNLEGLSFKKVSGHQSSDLKSNVIKTVPHNEHRKEDLMIFKSSLHSEMISGDALDRAMNQDKAIVSSAIAVVSNAKKLINKK